MSILTKNFSFSFFMKNGRKKDQFYVSLLLLYNPHWEIFKEPRLDFINSNVNANISSNQNNNFSV